MTLTVAAEPVTLREDASGTIRIGTTRVLLDMVLDAYRQGSSPEQIVRSYPTLSLDDVYAVVTWYLRHPADAEAYLRRREHEALEIRAILDSVQRPQTDLRARVQAQRSSSWFH